MKRDYREKKGEPMTPKEKDEIVYCHICGKPMRNWNDGYFHCEDCLSRVKEIRHIKKAKMGGR